MYKIYNLKKVREAYVVAKRYLEDKASEKGYVSNLDKVFMLRKTKKFTEKELIEVSNNASLASLENIEVLSLDLGLFVGCRLHAEALQESFGGTVENTGYSHIAECLWRPEKNTKLPLNDEAILMSLFNIVP